jgi:hypothetical protein
MAFLLEGDISYFFLVLFGSFTRSSAYNIVWITPATSYHCHVIEWLQTGFGLPIGFTEFLQVVTTSEDYALTVLHSSQIPIRPNRSPQSVTVFTSRCLVAAFNGGRSGYLTETFNLSRFLISWHGPHRKHCPSVAAYGPLPCDGIKYGILSLTNCTLHCT